MTVRCDCGKRIVDLSDVAGTVDQMCARIFCDAYDAVRSDGRFNPDRGDWVRFRCRCGRDHRTTWPQLQALAHDTERRNATSVAIRPMTETPTPPDRPTWAQHPRFVGAVPRLNR